MPETSAQANHKPQKRPQPKLTTVVDTYSLTPNMQRVVLHSEEFKQLQASDVGGYIKLLFHPAGHTDIKQLQADENPLMRTYTISGLDLNNGVICVDFVKHPINLSVPLTPEKGGYAIHWAMQTKIGDEIYISGAGQSQAVDFNAEQCIFIADMTAIPALTAQLTQLDEKAKGDVVLLLNAFEDMPDLTVPKGIHLHVMLSDLPFKLAQTVAEVELVSKDVAIWCACEFMAMKAIRAYFNEQNLVQRGKSYFSSYWKEGVTEDGHKVIKREDAKANQGS